MNEIIQQTLMFMASYIGLILAFYLSLNWMTKGFLSAYLKVKTSKGKKILTCVRSKTDIYYTTGRFKSDAFHYTTRDKDPKILSNVDTNAIYSSLGAFVLNVDETTDNVFTFEGAARIGTSATTADHLVKRAIMSPEIDDHFKKIVIFSLLAIGALLIIVLFLQYNMSETVKNIVQVGVV